MTWGVVLLFGDTGFGGSGSSEDGVADVTASVCLFVVFSGEDGADKADDRARGRTE